MQLIIPRSVLRPAVLRASATADAAATSGGITGLARLKASGKSLAITSTDLRVTAISVLPASVDKPGSVLIDADRLAGVIAKAPGDEIALTLNERTLTIKSGKSRVELLTQPDREYPATPDIDKASFAPCSPTLLGGMIAKALPAASTNESRTAVFGVALTLGSASAGHARMAATDGNGRLALAVADLALPEHAQVLIPPGGAKAIADLLRDAEECEIGWAGAYIMVRAGVTVMAVKLTDATFLPYAHVIPTKYATRAVFNRRAMLDALDRASFMTEKDDKDKIHGIALEIGDGALVVEAQHADYGNAHEEVDADVTGKPVRFGAQPRFLRDALRAVDTEQAAIETSGPFDAFVVRSAEAGPSLTVIMPMRL